MKRTGVIVLVHGSRGKHGRVEVEEAMEKMVASLQSYLEPSAEIVGAALQFNSPTLEEAVADLASRQINRIVVVPYFLFLGRHLTEHVPQALADLQVIYPEISFQLANNLGLDDYFISLLARRIRQVAPDLPRRVISSRGQAIESESMRIVENSVKFPPGLSSEEMTVVKRIIHASGDIDIARLIKFGPSAVSSGIAAIVAGRSIITDVRMVAAGINSSSAEACGCSISCALDEPEDYNDSPGNPTRSAAAIRHLGQKLNGAIVAIGNAPTALLALMDAMDTDNVQPSLIVGMPVGFVQAAESKEALLRRRVPSITIVGTRGGSAMTAATVNALLNITLAKKLA